MKILEKSNNSPFKKAAYEKIDTNFVQNFEIRKNLNNIIRNNNDIYDRDINNLLTFKGKEISESDKLIENVQNKSTKDLFFVSKEKEENENHRILNNLNFDEDLKTIHNKNAFSPLKKMLENSNNYNYNYSCSKITPSQKSTGNNFNNTMFSAGMLNIENNEVSRNFSIKLEIENIDKDIKILQSKLKNMINHQNLYS